MHQQRHAHLHSSGGAGGAPPNMGGYPPMMMSPNAGQYPLPASMPNMPGAGAGGTPGGPNNVSPPNMYPPRGPSPSPSQLDYHPYARDPSTGALLPPHAMGGGGGGGAGGPNHPGLQGMPSSLPQPPHPHQAHHPQHPGMHASGGHPGLPPQGHPLHPGAQASHMAVHSPSPQQQQLPNNPGGASNAAASSSSSSSSSGGGAGSNAMDTQDSGLFGEGLDAENSGAFGSTETPVMSFDADNTSSYGSEYNMFGSQPGSSFYNNGLGGGGGGGVGGGSGSVGGGSGSQPKQISGSAMQSSGDMEASIDAEYDAILNAQNRKRKHPTGGFGEANGEYPDISSPRMLHMPFTHTGAPSMVSGSIMGLHTQHQLSSGAPGSGSLGGGSGGIGMMGSAHGLMSAAGDVMIKQDPNNTSNSSTTSTTSANGVHGGGGGGYGSFTTGDGSPAGGISSSTASISNAMSMLDMVGGGNGAGNGGNGNGNGGNSLSGSNGNMDQKVNSMIVASDADTASSGADSEPLTPAYVPTETRIMANHTSKVLVCAFDMSGKYLATGGGGMDPPIRIWDMSTGEIHMMLKGHSHNVTGLRWSTNAQSPFLLLSCSLDSTIRLWDISNTDNPEVNVVRHTSSLNALDWHPSSVDRFVCTDHMENLVFWYMKDALGIVAQPTGQLNGVSNKQVRYSPSGRYIAAGLFSNQASTLKIIDADQQKVLFDVPGGHERQIIGIWWIDDSLLVSTSEDVVRVWRISENSVNTVREFTAPGDKTYYAITHPKTPSRILIGAFQKIYDWDYTNNKHRSIQCHEGIVSCLSYSQQSDILATTSHDKLVKLWKIGSS